MMYRNSCNPQGTKYFSISIGLSMSESNTNLKSYENYSLKIKEKKKVYMLSFTLSYPSWNDYFKYKIID